MTRQQLIESISNVDNDTILIYLILSEDADGNIYTNEQVCKLLKDYSKVPVLRFVQAGIGESVLGGNIVMHQEEGRIAADMVMQMLRGADPVSIEMVDESPNGFYFDQQVLDQFNISKTVIPDGAIIINQRLGFWEKYSFEILVTICVSAAVMFITLVSVRTVYAHRRYVELEKSNQQLEIAVNEAQSATRAKSVFLHSMSHDIRTPMNAIIGFTNIAIQQNTNVTVGEYLQKIMTSSKHLMSLINDVLDLSRIENGKAVYTPVPTDLCAINQEVMDINQGFVSEKNLIFQTDFPEAEKNCIVLADPVCIKEILMNILSNAIKFTEEEGSITFSMDMNPGEDEKHIVVCYTISDTGCGMSSDFLPHVFDEFAQEESGARTQYKGTGLGMAISKRYVDMMGGTINVESKLGEGTMAVIKMPLELTAMECQKKMTVPAMKEELNGVMVLMAEDNDLNAEIATVQLENCGMKVTRAVNGKDVVNIFANHPAGTYDVILMDIMMPEMNGYEAAKAIRDLENRPDGKEIPIIATTANAFVEDIQAALDAGMNGHLAKPLNMEEVKKMILVNLR